MKSRAIASLGDPGAFTLTDKDNPLYYIARFSHEMSMNFRNLNLDGFEFKQPENSDFNNVETAFDTYGNNLDTWFENAVQASEEYEEVPALPTIPDFTDIIPWLAANPWLAFLVKIAIRIGLTWLKKKLDPNTSGTEVAKVLKEIFIGETIGTTAEILEAGLFGYEEEAYLRALYDDNPMSGEPRGITRMLRKVFLSGTDPNEFSYMELVVQNPIKIWLTRSDMIDDMFISQM